MRQQPLDVAAAKRYNRRVRFTTVFFDLDDTLYPPSSGLWPTLKGRINRYMIERLGVSEQEVPALREQYFRRYGTTLRGLQANHQVDMADYLAYVHDVQLSDYIHPDPVQQAVLAELPTRNVVFTNADINHARRVLKVLEIEEYFAAVVDVNVMDPYCKPSAEAFGLALKAAGEVDPSRCVVIDDLPHTTRAARAFGFYALLYGSLPDADSAHAAFTDWRKLPQLLNGDTA
jgi:putative hydrolase of the HAD superfamily